MLLLVLKPEYDEFPCCVGQTRQGPQHRIVHVSAIPVDFATGWPGKHPAHGARMARADRLIIRVEQEAECRIEWDIRIRMDSKHELLEKPCRVRTMPFCWTGIRHRLDTLILIGQMPGKQLCVAADIPVALCQHRHSIHIVSPQLGIVHPFPPAMMRNATEPGRFTLRQTRHCHQAATVTELWHGPCRTGSTDPPGPYIRDGTSVVARRSILLPGIARAHLRRRRLWRPDPFGAVICGWPWFHVRWPCIRCSVRAATCGFISSTRKPGIAFVWPPSTPKRSRSCRAASSSKAMSSRRIATSSWTTAISNRRGSNRLRSSSSASSLNTKPFRRSTLMPAITCCQM